MSTKTVFNNMTKQEVIDYYSERLYDQNTLSIELAALQVKYDAALERIDELERDIKDLLYEANRNDF